MANPNPRDVPPEPDGPTATPATGRSSKSQILINGVVALLLGAGLAVGVHVLTHWIMLTVTGGGGERILMSVDALPQIRRDGALIAAAGPVVSVLLGLAMQVLQPFRFRGDFAHLLWIWTACCSLMLAAASLASTPFGGDLTIVHTSLQLPSWVAVVAVVGGVAAMLGVAHQWAIHAVRLCGRETRRLLAFSVYPWLIGALVQAAFVLAVLYLGRLDVPRSLAAVALLGGALLTAFAPLSMLFTARADELEEPLLVGRVPWIAVAALALVAAGLVATAIGVGVG